MVFGAWAVVGFEGMSDYPALLRQLQNVYAIRSVSLGTVAGGLGASVSTAVMVSWAAGVLVLGIVAWVARRDDGDRRAFTFAVLACIVASPIVWPYYFAFLLVPIAIVRPTFAPIWLYGYAVWLVGVVMPKSTVVKGHVCCRPQGVPEQAWLWSHADPSPWYAAGVMAVVVAVAVLAAYGYAHRRGGSNYAAAPR